MIDFGDKWDEEVEWGILGSYLADSWKILYVVGQHESFLEFWLLESPHVLQEVLKTHLLVVELGLQQLDCLLPRLETDVEV